MALGQSGIPSAAWRIPLGTPPANPGSPRPEVANMVIEDGYWQGAPVGGFGAGTFSRSYRGRFERWHVKTGTHKFQDVPANQFAVFAQPEGGTPVSMALSVGKPQNGTLGSWNWNYPAGDGEYAALYPKSWFSYGTKALPVKLTVEQFSPILPDNYKETSYPVAVYNWTAENPTNKPLTVSILFSWTNMVGWFRDPSHNFDGALNQQNTNRFVTETPASGPANHPVSGIVFDRLRPSPVTEEWDGQFAIATQPGDGAEVTYLGSYPANGDGSEVWNSFSKDGRLPNVAQPIASSGDPLAGAFAVRFTLAPHEKRVVPMALSWDLPVIQFGGGRKWNRHYTTFFGAEGTHAFEMARTALEHQEEWSAAIDAWQKPIVTDERKPQWYRAELFNELYFLADGGTLWGHERDRQSDALSPAKDNDRFSYLECFDYPFYGSLDVRFYGSFSLLRFWPELEKQEMREYTRTIPESNPQRSVWGWRSYREHRLVEYTRKTPGAAPHDLGAPGEDPLDNPNQYNYQDVSNWRDLNSKYVLMIWRDYELTGAKDDEFLRSSWSAVKLAMEHLKQYDTDGDGLIENGGFPDQTYDEWIATGESAYTGSLYLAALKATARMADKLGEPATAKEYDALEERAAHAYIKKLWTGSYFRYAVQGQDTEAVMAEQLAGQWYASLTGLGDLVPKNMRVSALHKVYDTNVRKFAKGEMGAINGIGTDGTLLHTNTQMEEVWVGATFAVASHMIAEGLHSEGFATAKGVNNVVWRDRGYFFRTPEAYEIHGLFRASMYMRPGSIWSMEYALDKK
ncbi:MAG: non-lysosomal glucosylceramidase [Terracidiphilus sp.]|nr:non-lysosomal glucosylceramidase [Terracidiphilus sp.]MDR3775261.1 non-lysosomal glucosylceramidase [Terracidiphilus sp.]